MLLIIVCIFTSAVAGATNPIECQNELAHAGPLDWSNDPAAVEVIRRRWSEFPFTDPRHHDRRHFTYLVSMAGCAPTRDGVQRFRALLESQRRGSASLVSESFPNTMHHRSWGFVLKISPANILATTPYDMASNGRTDRELRDIGLHTPECLLFESWCALNRIPRRHIRPAGVGTADHADAVFADWNEVAYLNPVGDRVQIEAIVTVPGLMIQRTSRVVRRKFQAAGARDGAERGQASAVDARPVLTCVAGYPPRDRENARTLPTTRPTTGPHDPGFSFARSLATLGRCAAPPPTSGPRAA